MDDSDFKYINELCENHSGWNIAYNKDVTKVWTKSVPNSNLHMIKANSILTDVPASIVYDVLHDPQYRSEWDKYHVATIDIGLINPNSDICYYAIGGMPPLQVRDFVLQRSWLDIGNEKYICSHSICHEKCPPVKGYIRGVVYLAAYRIRDLGKNGCQITYINHSDPKGNVPAWLTNHLTKVVGPKFIKKLHKACLKYEDWKQNNCPNWKPWIYPEQQINFMRVKLSECEPQKYTTNQAGSGIDESEMNCDNIDDNSTSDED
uniref:START domain-containing protein 10 n=1 Tax=Onchocerca volvulus TaxID=6282 RepID=A0A158N8Q7_ONCVO